VQILTISVYNAAGQRRDVNFRLDALNIISGDAQTGKSSLLDIVEYCLGTSEPQVPIGAITRTVHWYAVLFDLPTTRVIAARPRPEPGRDSQDRAMLVVGADLEPLEGDELRANMDRTTLRAELSRLLGIDEVVVGPEAERLGPDSAALGLRPNVGHAALLCLQAQNEIANRGVLFHRNNEERVRFALRDTLPYFLGAVPADQVARRQQLVDARRALRQAEAALAAADRVAQTREFRLQALVEEAHGAGLLPRPDYADKQEAVAALRDAAHLRAAPAGGADSSGLMRRRDLLRRQLREINEQRRLLDEHVASGEEYAGGLRVQRGRLTSLGLIPGGLTKPGATDAQSCPLCASALATPDPTAADLTASVRQVERQLADVEAGQPRRAAALAELEREAADLREQVRAVEVALSNLSDSGDPTRSAGAVEEAAFRRGRIHAMISQVEDTGAARRATIEAAVKAAHRHVDDLSDTLAADQELAQVNSRLRVISDTMSELAIELDVEHAGQPVQLDGRQLTVVVDTDDGPVRLPRIGSGANWMGYHIVAHLALHKYLIDKQRPVPRFLMIDQPTQAYYPPGGRAVRYDAEGLPEDADSEAVRRVFRMLLRFTETDARGLQIIVCEHAMLDEPWYAERVEHEWRDGEALIPADWLAVDDAASQTEPPPAEDLAGP
jgi:hypothetical protein